MSFVSLFLDEVTWEKNLTMRALKTHPAESDGLASAPKSPPSNVVSTWPASGRRLSLSPHSFSPPPFFFLFYLWRIFIKMKRHPPPSLFAVLPLLFWASLSGDCYRRTDHAVIRDYIYPERVGGDDGKDPVTPDNGVPPTVFYFFWCQQLKGIIVIKRIPNKQTKIDSRKCSLIQ